MAHGARYQTWLGWVLRTIIGIFFGVELMMCLGWSGGEELSSQLGGVLTPGQWGLGVTASLCASTGGLLFYYIRLGLSYALTVVDRLISGQVLIAAIKRANVLQSFVADRIFQPASVPHLVALWIYVTTACFLLGSIDPTSVKVPLLPIPIPVPLEQLLSYNGLGLVLLALCGVGIFVTRKPAEAFARVGWAKPTWKHVALGIFLIFVTFGYDYVWSLFTHHMEGELAPKLSSYNAGTFTAGGGFGSSLMLAIFTGVCAGVGEETLIRGAIQPALGIVPAAILHGLLHGQFSHAPIYLVQVAGWSVLMGIVRRYTNTTTTIIAHAGFNFLATFLFAFNP
jgi:hypothetical protein